MSHTTEVATKPTWHRPRCSFLGLLALMFVLGATASRGWATVPFDIAGPGVDPDDFVMTTFAENLSYPLGMAELDDGSILVGVSNGNNYFGATTGQILRLADNDGDGVAETRTTVVADVPGGKLTSLRVWNDLVFVTGQAKPISIYRLGAIPTDALSPVGSLDFTYPVGGWTHRHSALQVRDTPGTPGSVDILFQLGSDTNYGATTRTAELSSTANLGISATIAGDALHMITIADNGTDLSATATAHVQLATGVRNGAGLAFHPTSGDLWFEDNGIDGFVDANEPTSADELNVIAAADIGGAIEDFGFHLNYTEYRTENIIGGAGVQPIVAFQPVGDPLTGAESEGPNDIAFAPPAFPAGLNNGVFVGFHGRGSLGGVANEENPVVFYDISTDSYFHFIANDETAIGHLIGVISTYDSLYLADVDPDGSLADPSAGAIYKIRALTPGDANDDGKVDGLDYLNWADHFGDNPAEDPPGPPANGDLNHDDVVDGLDYIHWATHYGQGPNDAVAVPEPGALLLCTLGLLALGTTSRRRGMRNASNEGLNLTPGDPELSDGRSMIETMTAYCRVKTKNSGATAGLSSNVKELRRAQPECLVLI